MGGKRRGRKKVINCLQDSIATTGMMHKGSCPCVACLYGHKITANNEESDNKRKERIGEGGNGWGQGRNEGKEGRGNWKYGIEGETGNKEGRWGGREEREVGR